MTISALHPEQPSMEVRDGALLVHRQSFTGTIVGVAVDRGLENDPAGLGRLLTDAVEIGATVLRDGQSQSVIAAVALEIDRLVATASDETEKLPAALKEPLADHLQRLSDLLAENFDPKRARSLQRQLPAIVGEVTGTELRRLVQEVLDDGGAVGTHLELFAHSNTETLTRVNTLLGRIEQKLQLDEQIERSPHKGRPFEEVVHAELEAIHGPLGDTVRCVRHECGLLPKRGKGTQVGDYLVVLNPEHTRGREVSYVVEAKTGDLNANEAKRELEAAMTNRGAAAGVLVFDGVDDAPLGGRYYLPHGDGRFTAVFDVENGTPLAFEVACREARLAALATIHAERRVDQAALEARCNLICDAVEEASRMLRSISAIERGASEARDCYTHMRKQVFDLIDELREQAD